MTNALVSQTLVEGIGANSSPAGRVSQFVVEVVATNFPGVPNLSAVSETTSTISVAWNFATGITSYTLQYRVTGSSGWTQITGITGTTYTATSLMSGTSYDFQVQALNSYGTSAFCSVVAISTIPVTAPAPAIPQSLGGWRGIVGINWNGMTLIGDKYSGVVGLYSFSSYTEYGNPLQGLIITPPVQMDRKRVFIKRFEIDVQAGVGTTGGQGFNPVWMLDVSKDGGVTWTTLQTFRSMGETGQYLQRLRWLRMGTARQWLFRLRSTDPVPRNIIGFYLDAKPGMD